MRYALNLHTIFLVIMSSSSQAETAEPSFSWQHNEKAWKLISSQPKRFVDEASSSSQQEVAHLASLFPIVMRISISLSELKNFNCYKIFTRLELWTGLLERFCQSLKDPQDSQGDTSQPERVVGLSRGHFTALAEDVEAWRKSIERLTKDDGKASVQPTFDRLYKKLLSDLQLALREMERLRPRRTLVGMNCKIPKQSHDQDPVYELSLHTLEEGQDGTMGVTESSVAVTSAMRTPSGSEMSLSQILPPDTRLIPESLYGLTFKGLDLHRSRTGMSVQVRPPGNHD
jgi:hypothetical protein